MIWYVVLGATFAAFLALTVSDHGRALLGRADFDPRLLGRQVWLVATAGLLIGAFPALDGELLSRHAAVVITALTGSVLVTVAIPLRRRHLARVGAALAAGGWGGLLGALVTGGPLGTVAFAALHLALTATHGAADRHPRRLAMLTLGAALATAAVVVPSPGVRVGALPAYPLLVWIVVLLAGLGIAVRTRRARVIRLVAAAALALQVPLMGLLTWPYALIPERDGSGGLLVADVLAHPATLDLLTLVALPALPLAVLIQVAAHLARTTRVEGHSPDLG